MLKFSIDVRSKRGLATYAGNALAAVVGHLCDLLRADISGNVVTV